MLSTEQPDHHTPLRIGGNTCPSVVCSRLPNTTTTRRALKESAIYIIIYLFIYMERGTDTLKNASGLGLERLRAQGLMNPRPSNALASLK